jgi:hypothetical protein
MSKLVKFFASVVLFAIESEPALAQHHHLGGRHWHGGLEWYRGGWGSGFSFGLGLGYPYGYYAQPYYVDPDCG